MFHVDTNYIEIASAATKVGNYQESFSLLVRVDDENWQISFVAEMQNAEISYVTTTSSARKIWRKI